MRNYNSGSGSCTSSASVRIRTQTRIPHWVETKEKLLPTDPAPLVPTSYACEQLVGLVTDVGDVAPILSRVSPLVLLVSHLAVL